MREGYQNASQMPSFQGKLNEQELTALTEFMKAMNDDAVISAVSDGDLSQADKQNLDIADAEEAEQAMPAATENN